MVAGTSEERVEECRALELHLDGLGFDPLSLRRALGPDVPEALQLLSQEVIPALLD